MRIHFERTGGVGGMRMACEIVSEQLRPDEQQRLSQLVADSGLFEMRAARYQDPDGADRFEYAITIDTGSGTHAVRVAEARLPARLRPLIRWLTKAAQHSRP
jgi:hypothetical protein